jgi:hypothetical protein
VCRRLVLCPSEAPHLLPRNRFLRHYADLPPSAPDFVTAMGVLTRWHRQRRNPLQHAPKQTPVQMSLGQQQPVVPGVLDQSPTRFAQPLLQARQGPVADAQRQHQPPPQIPQVVSDYAQPQSGLIGAEAMATQPGHLQRLLAFLDPLFGRAALVVEPHHRPAG